MLRKIIYDTLTKIYYYVMCLDLFDINEETKFGKLLLMSSKIGWAIIGIACRIGFFFFMVSITGGLYLIWVGFKLIRRRSKTKHNKTKSRKRA